MRFVIIIFFQIYLVQCQKPRKPYTYLGPKHWGISLAAPANEIDKEHFETIKSLNSNSITLMPYAFVPKGEAKVRFSYDSTAHQQWWGETPGGIRKCIDLAKEQQMEVLLKPHLWIGGGQFTGNLDFEDDEKWGIFEASYIAYIIEFAKIAEEKQVRTFCIGTELATHVRKRPAFWTKLILAVRQVYHGQLTYAENWDTYTDVPFWDKLDFIGVDAYFPLSDKKNPELSEIKKGWSHHKNALKEVSYSLQKPILFTEIGYRSNDYALDKPWETDYSKPTNQEIQARAYQAFFEEISLEKWFAGAYFWKWITDSQSKYGSKDTFTPQGKKGEKIIETNFKLK